MRKKKWTIIALALLCLCGCQPSKKAFETGALQTEKESGVREKRKEDMFTAKDWESDYKEEETVKITLTGSGAECSDGGVWTEGSTVTIRKRGTYLLSGSLTDGMVIVSTSPVDEVRLILSGVSIRKEDSAAIYVRSAGKVFVTTAADTVNTLVNGGKYEAIDDNNIDAVIFSKAALTLNGKGVLCVEAMEGHGIVSKDALTVTEGSYEITSARHGLSGKDSVRIGGGSYKINAGKNGISAKNEGNGKQGFVYLEDGSFLIDSANDGIHASSDIQMDGGSVTIAAMDDGMHADGGVLITGGSLQITESYEGIEGLCIELKGGDITLAAQDDGMNAAGGNDSSGFEGGDGDIFAKTEGAYIRILGGKLSVNALGDGIDSNGDVIVSGGETYVSGPVNNGNGALDYAGEAIITGGIFVAAGSVGMAQNFGEASLQGAMLVTTDGGSADSEIALYDDSGRKLLSFLSPKAYGCVVVSCPEIVQGGSYLLKAGDTETEITMDSLIYGNGFGMPGPGGPGFPGGPGKGDWPKDFEGEFPGGPDKGDWPKDFEGEFPGGPDKGDWPKDFEGEFPGGPDKGDWPKDFEGEFPGGLDKGNRP